MTPQQVLELAKETGARQFDLRFTDARFRPAVAVTNGDPSADRAADGSSGPTDEAVDREMESWLKEKRAATRIQFKKEAFE